MDHQDMIVETLAWEMIERRQPLLITFRLRSASSQLMQILSHLLSRFS